MMHYDQPTECGGVLVRSGDLIFADVDGVVVIPAGIAPQVVQAALDKVESENSTRAELARGMLLGDVYKKYGVL